jgi:DNA-binding MarR family transcriptional regulator
VTRERDPADERRVLVGLTTEGAALRAKAADVPARLAARFGGDPAAGAELRDQLRALVAALDAADG